MHLFISHNHQLIATHDHPERQIAMQKQGACMYHQVFVRVVLCVSFPLQCVVWCAEWAEWSRYPFAAQGEYRGD